MSIAGTLVVLLVTVAAERSGAGDVPSRADAGKPRPTGCETAASDVIIHRISEGADASL